VFSPIDLPKNGELRLPIGVAGLTLFNALRIDAVSVRLYRFAVAMPPNTLAMPFWFAFPPRRIDSLPRISSSSPGVRPTHTPTRQQLFLFPKLYMTLVDLGEHMD
jgi:hypothetical protein